MKDIETVKRILINTDDEVSHTDYERCKQCFEKNGFTCCTEFPCEINASDLVEISEYNIRELLESGLVIIDRWEDNIGDNDEFQLPTTLYLRMKGSKDSDYFDFGFNFYEDKCLCLEENGCILPFCNRPYYGRMFDCKSFPRKELCSGKFDAAKSWLPYQDILENVLDEILDDVIE